MSRRMLVPVLVLLGVLSGLLTTVSWAQTVQLTDATGIPVSVVLEGETLHLQVEDPSAFDTVDVTVTTSLAGDSEVVTLDELSATPGRFVGSLTTNPGGLPQPGTLETATDPGPPFSRDTITATYGSATAVATLVGSQSRFVDTYGNTRTSYAVGETFRAEVRDQLRNDPGLLDSFALEIYNQAGGPGTGEMVTMTESDFDTGTFEGSTSSPLYTSPGETIALVHTDGDGASTSQASATLTASETTFIDAEGVPTSTFLESSETHVRVVDTAADFDPLSEDTVGIDLSAQISSDFETLTLTETGQSTGVFEGSIPLSINPASSTNGVLETGEDPGQPSPFDTLTATYFDPSGTSSDTSQTLGSRTWFIDADGRLTDFVVTGELAHLRVEDPNRNTDPGQFDTTTVDLVAATTLDAETVNLLETAKDSGIFEGSIATEDGTLDFPGDGALQLYFFEEIQATHADALGNSTSQATAAVRQERIDFVDATGSVLLELLEGSVARIRVIDHFLGGPPNTVETVTAVVTSLQGGDSETVTLTETGPETNTFTTTLPLTLLGGSSEDGFLTTAGSGPPQFLPDTLTATYVGPLFVDPVTTQVSTVGSYLAFLDAFGNPIDAVAVEDLVRVRLVEPSRDDPGQIDTVTLTLQGFDAQLQPGDSEPVVLTETGFSTGIFEGSIPSTRFAAPVVDGFLWLDFGFFAELQHSNFGDGTPNTLRVPVAGSTVEFVDANGNPVEVVLQGAEAFIRVFDPSANFDPGSVDSTGVDLETELSGDFESLNLTETGSDTNVFVGSINTSIDPASPSDGVLQVTEALTAIFERDTITATHFDPYGASTDTIGTLGSRTLFIDSNGDPIDVYAVGGTVYVRVEDANRNTDAGQFDTTEVDVYAPASGDTETLFLLETSKDSGVFEGSITLDNSGAASPDGLLQALPGDTIDASHADALGNSISTDTAQIADLALEFFDAEGTKTDVLLESDLARVRLTSLGDNSDPGLVDTATVDLTSLYGGDSETLVLTETHPNSGMFEGVLGLTLLGGTSQDGVLSTAGSGPPQFLPDTVTASRGGMSVTATTVGSRLAFLDGFGQTVSFVATGDTLRVRVVEPSRDDPGLIDTLSVTLQGLDPTLGVDSETVVLTETGFSTGVFEGALPSTQDGSSTAGDGQLWLDFGFFAELQHSNFGDGTPNTLRVPVAGSTVEFVDANDNPVEVVLQGAEAFVRVFDPSANFDPGSVDSTGVDLETELSGDFESLNLTETGNDTNVFVGSINTSIAPASPSDGVLQVTEVLTAIFERDTITATHFDPYGASTDTVGTLGSRTLFIDSNGDPIDVYAVGSTVYVRVEDANRNSDAGQFDTTEADIYAPASGDTETLFLLETSKDSGVFEGSITLDNNGAASPDGLLQALPGDTIDASHADALGNSISTDTAQIADLALEFLDAEGAKTDVLLESDLARVRLTSLGDNSDPGFVDTATVDLSSLYGGDSETLVLTETHPNSGMFEGALGLTLLGGTSQDGVLSTAGSGPPQFLPDTVTASRGGMSITATTVGSRLAFLDGFGQTVSFVATGGTLRVRVVEPSRDDPGLIDSLSVTLQSLDPMLVGVDSETVVLTETGFATGIFEGAIPSTQDGSSTAGDGQLWLDFGFFAELQHSNFGDGTPNTLRVPVAGSTVEFVDASGNPVDVVLQGAEAFVRVFDPAANFDPGSVDSTGVDLETELSGDFESLNLTETGSDTNVFVGSINTSIDPASPSDGILQVTEALTAIFERDTITATHFDPYGASTDTVGTLGSRTLFIDSNGDPIDVYAVGGTVYVRVEDANRNTDAGQFDTSEIDVYAPASGDTETLFLLETSKDSGVFEGSITLDSSGAASPDGLLQALPGDTIDASHADALGNSISTDTAQVADLALEFFDAEGAKTEVLLESDLARVRLTSLGDNSDPGLVDTATVDLSSLYGGDSETLVLTETHPNSGMFEGALGLTLLGGTSQDGVLSTAGSGPPQFLPDTVTASRGGMSITATTVGSRLAFLDGFGQTVSFVATGDTLRVQVVEPSRDDPGLIDTLSVTLQSLDPTVVSVDSETVVLTETGFATGIFEGAIPSTQDGSGTAGDGQLWLDFGFFAELQHSNFGDGTPNTLRVPVAGSTVEFVDANGNPVEVVLQGAEAFVRVFDPSANFDPGSVDSTGVDLETELSGDFESLNLTETGNDTNVFVGSINTSIDPASPSDGVLQVTEALTAIFERDTITATHFDPYGASTDTVGTLGSRTLFIDSNGASADRYVLGDLVGIRVEAPARNTDNGAFDTLTVDLQTSIFFDTETLTLTETGLDSGIFEGVISLVEGLANPNNGALEAVNADFLDVSYADVLGNSVSTDTAEVSDTRIDFVDAVGAPVSEVLAASTALVAVTSPSANLDPGMIDSVVVEVRSLYGGDTETLVAVEVAPDAGLFEGQLPMAVGTGASFDGLLTTYNSGPPQFLGDSLTASVGVETATVGVIEARVEFFDLLGQTTDTFATGSQVGLRIEEPAVNLDPMLVESLVRSVVVPQTGDSETVTLLETATDSGRFEAMVASDDLASMVDDGLLTTAASFVVRVEHLGAFGTIPLVAEATVVANRVPVAMPDTVLTQLGQSVDIDVVANDSDPELEALTLIAVQQPTQGTAVLLGGLARYTPNLGAQGTDSFSYVVRDASGGLALGSVSVTINAPPTVDITSPMDGSIFFEGQSVPIYGMATDAEDGDLSGDLAWSSDLDGSLGTGANLVLSTLSVGTHTLTATVTDSGGLAGQAAVTVTIDFNNPPTVDIASPTDGTSVAQGVAVTFTATAIDTEEGILTPNLAWTSDVDGPIGAGGTFDIASLSVATHTVTASVTDSLGKTGDATVQLTIMANSAPVVTITAPADGTTATEGDPVTFAGTSNDAESGDLSGDLAWTSDLDGALGTGANLVITSLSVGTHTITATSTDPQGLEGTATVTITVDANTEPVVTITSPADGATFIEGDTVNLVATANDAEDGDLAASIAWTSSLDGALGSGGTLALSNLSVGTHTLTAAVTDSHGANGSDTVSITVNTNNPPTVTITGPADGATFTEGDTVNLVATANDAEDGDITASIAWTSSLDGALGSGGTLALSSLSVGTHTLTAAVTDSHGANGSDAVSITISANNPPVVTITSPANGAAVTEGDTVNLVANANDAEDGDITAAIAWTSSLDGSLGSGGTLALSSLSVGTHTLTASVTDSHGANGSDTVSITVNANNPPTVTITSPADGATFTESDTVNLAATANDAEDGDLTASIAWTSSLDGALGSGGTLALSSLSVGTHTLTAAVTDSHGANGFDTVSITVNANNPPVVTITSPANGSRHAMASTVTFVGNALDVENGDLSAAIAWSSDLDGSLGTGSSVATAGLSLGTHTITAQVTDALGAVGLAGITVEIKQPVSVTLLSVAAEDGYLRESNENSGVGSTAVAGNKGRRSLRIGDDGGDRQYKLLVSFDTASLPVGAQVLSAQLRLRRGRVQGTNPFDTHGSARVDIMTGGFGGNIALAASDFEATPTASQVAALSNALSDGAWSEGSLDSAGIASINPTGRTQLRVAFDLDDNDDGGNDQMGYYAANNNNSSNHPQLVITYLD